jgi:transposase-like protein
MGTREIAAGYRLTHWARVVQDRSDSGLSIRAYCKNEGIRENTYFYWLKKLRETACGELTKIQGDVAGLTAPRFMEVKLPAQTALPQAVGIRDGQVCIEAAGIKITAGAGYPAGKLAELLREVARP